METFTSRHHIDACLRVIGVDSEVDGSGVGGYLPLSFHEHGSGVPGANHNVINKTSPDIKPLYSGAHAIPGEGRGSARPAHETLLMCAQVMSAAIRVRPTFILEFKRYT